MKRRKGFTREQHERVGLELARMRDRLGNLWCCIQRAEGVGRGKKLLRTTRAIQVAIDALRDELSKTFWSVPRMDYGDPYYPSAEVRMVEPGDKPLTYEEMDRGAATELRRRVEANGGMVRKG